MICETYLCNVHDLYMSHSFRYERFTCRRVQFSKSYYLNTLFVMNEAFVQYLPLEDERRQRCVLNLTPRISVSFWIIFRFLTSQNLLVSFYFSLKGTFTFPVFLYLLPYTLWFFDQNV